GAGCAGAIGEGGWRADPRRDRSRRQRADHAAWILLPDQGRQARHRGLFGGGAPWALPLIPIKAITIQGSYVGNLRETAELLDLVRNKMIAPIPVTTLPLAKANEALVDLQKGKLVGRAVLTP